MLSKEKKLHYIIKHCEENNITAYIIGKNTGLNISGVDRILKNQTKNPNSSTINLIYDFLKKPDTYLNNNTINEPTEEYNTFASLQLAMMKLQNEHIELLKEKARLVRLLEDNNIKF
jgi:transcriptional regulator with XRE-family HTH domain